MQGFYIQINVCHDINILALVYITAIIGYKCPKISDDYHAGYKFIYENKNYMIIIKLIISTLYAILFVIRVKSFHFFEQTLIPNKQLHQQFIQLVFYLYYSISLSKHHFNRYNIIKIKNEFYAIIVFGDHQPTIE